MVSDARQSALAGLRAPTRNWKLRSLALTELAVDVPRGRGAGWTRDHMREARSSRSLNRPLSSYEASCDPPRPSSHPMKRGSSRSMNSFHHGSIRGRSHRSLVRTRRPRSASRFPLGLWKSTVAPVDKCERLSGRGNAALRRRHHRLPLREQRLEDVRPVGRRSRGVSSHRRAGRRTDQSGSRKQPGWRPTRSRSSSSV